MAMNLCASLARNGKTYESAYPSEQRLKSMGTMEAGTVLAGGGAAFHHTGLAAASDTTP